MGCFPSSRTPRKHKEPQTPQRTNSSAPPDFTTDSEAGDQRMKSMVEIQKKQEVLQKTREKIRKDNLEKARKEEEASRKEESIARINYEKKQEENNSTNDDLGLDF